MKKVSIIIPCYNCEKTLKRCLNSVFSQTYKNIEVIAVNDGSKDNSLALLKAFQLKHKNLYIFDKLNEGVSATRNFGLSKATGDYIQFMDSDDNFTKKTVISTLCNIMDKNKVDVVIFNFKHKCFETYLNSGIYNLQCEEDFFKVYCDFFVCSMPWNKMFKREVIKTKFDITMNFAEDEIFCLANLKNAKRIYYTSKVFYNYYCAPTSKKGNASLINKLYEDKNFSNNEKTIWYGSIKNMSKRYEIFNKEYSEIKSKMEFIRLFDFYFFDFAFMNNLNVSRENQKHHLENMLNNKMFWVMLKFFEKYGLKMKKDKNYKDLVESFVDLGAKAYSDIKHIKKLKLYKVLFTLFGVLFFDKEEKSKTYNILVECLDEYDRQLTSEAIFCKDLILSQGV